MVAYVREDTYTAIRAGLSGLHAKLLARNTDMAQGMYTDIFICIAEQYINISAFFFFSYTRVQDAGGAQCRERLGKSYQSQSVGGS